VIWLGLIHESGDAGVARYDPSMSFIGPRLFAFLVLMHTCPTHTDGIATDVI
jgi:hypothetical protein